MWHRNSIRMNGIICKDPRIRTNTNGRKYLDLLIINKAVFSPAAKRQQFINVRGFGFYKDWLEWVEKGDMVDAEGLLIVRRYKLDEKIRLGKVVFTHGHEVYIHLKQLYDYTQFNRIYAGSHKNLQKPDAFFKLMNIQMQKGYMKDDLVPYNVQAEMKEQKYAMPKSKIRKKYSGKKQKDGAGDKSGSKD